MDRRVLEDAEVRLRLFGERWNDDGATIALRLLQELGQKRQIGVGG